MERVRELESIVLAQLYGDVPIWTGNLSRHITPLGIGHIRISGPAYKEIGYKLREKIKNKKKEADSLGIQYRGIKDRLSYSQMGVRNKISTRRWGDLLDYAFLLNECGAFGTGRHEHWTNRSIYSACVQYQTILQSRGYDVEIINKLPL